MTARELDVTDAAAVARGGAPATTSWSTPRRGPTSTAPRTARGRGDRGQRRWRRSCSPRPARPSGARLVHVSTDYVFDGDGDRAVRRGRADRRRVNAYGADEGWPASRRCRALLPETGYVVRTAWLYGEHGGNFVADDAAAGRRARHRRRRRRPASASRPGRATWRAAAASRWSARRRAPAGHLPRHRGRRDDLVRPGPRGVRGARRWTRTGSGRRPRDAFPRPAPRPAYSVLGHERVGRAPASHRWATGGRCCTTPCRP